MAAEEEKRDEALDALFPPKREVRLVSGEVVLIEPWGIELGLDLMPKVVELGERLGTDVSDGGVVKAVKEATPEVLEIIRRTIGWTHADIMDPKRVKFEDVFTLAQAVLEVCVIRGDGSGALGKVLSLGTMFLGAKAETSPRP